MTDPAPAAPASALLVRHAETEWSRSGRHTGRTDVPLTPLGRSQALALAPRVSCGAPYELVLVSPSRRARETCELCGLGGQARETADLGEWDYGDYEGLTTMQILARRPGWSLWRDGCPGGETADEVGERADRVIAELRGARGGAIVFSHGHLLRVLGARWIGLQAGAGGRLGLSAGGICRLAYEHEVAVLAAWNETPPAAGAR